MVNLEKIYDKVKEQFILDLKENLDKTDTCNFSAGFVYSWDEDTRGTRAQVRFKYAVAVGPVYECDSEIGVEEFLVSYLEKEDLTKGKGYVSGVCKLPEKLNEIFKSIGHVSLVWERI